MKVKFGYDFEEELPIEEFLSKKSITEEHLVVPNEEEQSLLDNAKIRRGDIFTIENMHDIQFVCLFEVPMRLKIID